MGILKGWPGKPGKNLEISFGIANLISQIRYYNNTLKTWKIGISNLENLEKNPGISHENVGGQPD